MVAETSEASKDHREHTILLSMERGNKGMKRMNSLPLSPLIISFTLRDFTGKTTAYKSCVTLIIIINIIIIITLFESQIILA